MDDISLGTGIFGGLVALAFVILIFATKDKWKWGRIKLVIIALPVIAILALVGFEYYQSLPKATLEYAGLRLGMPRKDVIFLKGQPYDIINSGLRKVDEILMYHVDSSPDTLLVVGVEEDRVFSIVYGGDSYYEYGLYGVSLGSDYATVIDKLGEPSKTEEQTETSRSLYYVDYNLQVGLHEGQVISFGISVDPDICGWINIAPKSR
jgi:hypothetical protein